MHERDNTITSVSEFERYRARRQQRTLPFAESGTPAAAPTVAPRMAMAKMTPFGPGLSARDVAHRSRMLDHLQELAAQAAAATRERRWRTRDC